MLHIRPASGVAVVVLVLDLVFDDRAGPVRQLVPGQDAVDLSLPLVGVLEVVRITGPGRAGLGGQPAWEAATVNLGVDVRTGSRDHIDAYLLGDVQQLVDIPYASEVVNPRRRRVVTPVEVERCGVESGRLHLLQHVTPEILAGQPEVVELSGP